MIKAIQEQSQQLIHCSNLYYIEPQIRLAELLCQQSFAERCFFANSGAEANEAAIKLARLHSKKKFGENRYTIIAFYNSFHGRTMATLSATGQEKVQQGFEPLLPGFKFAEFNNIESVRNTLDDSVCAIMIEPVQGEGGVMPAEAQFMKQLRQLCDQKRLLLIFDEIQCGLGRTGQDFAYQHYEIEPDMMTLAKALGEGIPIGTLLAKGEVATAFQPGNHASTFGGNPLACAAALASLKELFNNQLAKQAEQIGRYLRQALNNIVARYEIIKEVRGLGLMLGLELTVPAKQIVDSCREKALLVGTAGEKVLRLLPPLIITANDCDRAVEILDRAFQATKLTD